MRRELSNDIYSGDDIRHVAAPLRDHILSSRSEPLETYEAQGLVKWGFIYDGETQRLYLGDEAFRSFVGYVQRQVGEST